MASAARRAFLLVLEEARAGRLHLLSDAEVLIGRSPAADVQLTDVSVSQEHAKISPRADGFYLVDLGSRNGSVVNGRRIVEHRLRKHDRVEIGETSLLFLEESSSDATVTVAIPRRDSVVDQGFQQALRAPTTVQPEAEPNPLIEMLRNAVKVARFMRRHIWLMVLLPLLGLGAGAQSVRVMPPPEMAEATVRLLHYMQSNPVDGTSDNSRSRGDPVFFRDPIANFVDSDLVDSTLQHMGVANPKDKVGIGVSALNIEMTRDGSYVVTCSQPPGRPLQRSSVEFLEAYLESYLTHEVDEAIRVLKSEASFLESELNEVAGDLDQVQEEIVEYRGDHLDALPEQSQSIMANKQLLTSRRVDLELEVERLKIQVANAKSRLAEADDLASKRINELKPLRDELRTKQAELAALTARGLRNDHPDVRAVQARIDDLNREISQRGSAKLTDVERASDPELQSLRQNVEQLQGDLRVSEQGLSNVRSQLGSATSREAEVPEVEANVGRLAWRKESLEALRRRLFDQHKKKQLQIDLEIANVKGRYDIIAPPHGQRVKALKFWGTRLGIGFAAGLALALLIAAILEVRKMFKTHPELLRVS